MTVPAVFTNASSRSPAERLRSAFVCLAGVLAWVLLFSAIYGGLSALAHRGLSETAAGLVGCLLGQTLIFAGWCVAGRPGLT